MAWTQSLSLKQCCIQAMPWSEWAQKSLLNEGIIKFYPSSRILMLLCLHNLRSITKIKNLKPTLVKLLKKQRMRRGGMKRGTEFKWPPKLLLDFLWFSLLFWCSFRFWIEWKLGGRLLKRCLLLYKRRFCTW